MTNPEGEILHVPMGGRRALERLRRREQADPSISRQEFLTRVTEHYGDAGVHAAESCCLEAGDYLLGYEHCLNRILPALEEEMIADGSLNQ